MPSTGIAPGVSKTPASIHSNQKNLEAKPQASVRVFEGAHCFYWIAGLVIWDSLFTILGSHVHHFSELGAAGIIGSAQASATSGAVHVIVSCWLAAGFLSLGYYAAKGQEWAYAVGMAAYVVDGALMVAVGNSTGAVFHALVLYAIYRGFAALGQPSGSRHSEVASAAHAG